MRNAGFLLSFLRTVTVRAEQLLWQTYKQQTQIDTKSQLTFLHESGQQWTKATKHEQDESVGMSENFNFYFSKVKIKFTLRPFCNAGGDEKPIIFLFWPYLSF